MTPPAGSASAGFAGRRPGRIDLPGVRAVIAVASGKGGVGKSTVAVNLAAAFVAFDLRVGLLDADIYGPSVPRMLGVTDLPPASDGTGIVPLRRHGITCMSIGFVVPDDQPVIWRGPLVAKTLERLLGEVAWGNLDVLVVDLPPGTGDAQITLAQRAPLSGAVIVSTPQDIALVDARKGLKMFEKVGVPVLGILENMSYFLCPHCGARHHVLAHGGARMEADRIGVEFLGEIPLDTRICEASDFGMPIVLAEPDSEQARAFKTVASRVWDRAFVGVSGPAGGESSVSGTVRR